LWLVRPAVDEYMNAEVVLEREPDVAPRLEIPSAVTTDKRIPALDGLRGLAIIAVVSYHFGPHIVRDTSSPFMFLHRIPSFWFEGVDLFFVLSGFLISGILTGVRQSSRY
jgi:peptidoglycan/LPS O-acetylase OafA/YrhL